jgi:hypothetical protein
VPRRRAPEDSEVPCAVQRRPARSRFAATTQDPARSRFAATAQDPAAPCRRDGRTTGPADSRRRSAGAPNFSLHLSCRDPECDHLIATMLLYLQVYCDGSYVGTSKH